MLDTEKSGDATANERRKVFFGLFVFPMLIAVTMAVLLSAIVLLTKEDEKPESLVTAIKTGAPSKRWQKAFELSNELNSQDGLIRSAGVMKEVIHILNDKDHYDGKTRAYMAMALARFQNPEARDALLEALRGTDDTEDPEVPLFIMWALGDVASRTPRSEVTDSLEVSNEVARFLESEHDDLRKGAAYILGVLDDESAAVDLKNVLDDPVADVRWNAALSLARLGDGSGLETLVEMLERERLTRVYGLGREEIERVMVNAAKGLGLVLQKGTVPEKGDSPLLLLLTEVSKSDPSLKVRQAALAALEGY